MSRISAFLPNFRPVTGTSAASGQANIGADLAQVGEQPKAGFDVFLNGLGRGGAASEAQPEPESGSASAGEGSNGGSSANQAPQTSLDKSPSLKSLLATSLKSAAPTTTQAMPSLSLQTKAADAGSAVQASDVTDSETSQESAASRPSISLASLAARLEPLSAAVPAISKYAIRSTSDLPTGALVEAGAAAAPPRVAADLSMEPAQSTKVSPAVSRPDSSGKSRLRDDLAAPEPQGTSSTATDTSTTQAVAMMAQAAAALSPSHSKADGPAVPQQTSADLATLRSSRSIQSDSSVTAGTSSPAAGLSSSSAPAPKDISSASWRAALDMQSASRPRTGSMANAAIGSASDGTGPILLSASKAAAVPSPDASALPSPRKSSFTGFAAQSARVSSQASTVAGTADKAVSSADLPAMRVISASASDHETGTAAIVPVAMLAQETHFPPVANLSPVAQIANFVATQLPTKGVAPSSTDGGAAATSADATTAVSSQGVSDMVKTLSLQLEPDDLGSVVITMRLSASGLDLQVAVSQPQAMQVIEKDKDALSDALRSTGYTVGSLDVTAAQAAHLNAGFDQSAQGQAAGGQTAQSNSTFTTYQGGDGSAYDRSASRENRQGAASPQQDRDSSASTTAPGDDLYV